MRTRFVSIKGSPYSRFRRSLEIGRLPIVLARLPSCLAWNSPMHSKSSP
jgi:hypothetical protein